MTAIKQLFLEKGAKDNSFLTEYLDLTSRKSNAEYTERHHICPKCVWPEYSDLRANRWNSSTLSLREHILAHFLLVKIFPNEQKTMVRYSHDD